MKVCTVSGVQIHLNNIFLALLGLFFVAGVLAKGLIAFSIVLLHELAHVAAARRLGVNVADVELLPFGGVCRIGGEVVLDPAREVLVASAGPAANLLLAGFGTALRGYGLWDDQLTSFFIQSNLLIASFNLLPALPLDGGRVFRAYLARRVGFKEATYKAAWLGQFWGVSIVLLGAAGLLLGISGLDILIAGSFLLYAATREKGLAPFHFIRHLTQKKLELVAAGVLPAEPLVSFDDVRLQDVTRAFIPQRFHVVILLDKDWQYRGVVSEAQIVDALFNKGMDINIGELLK
ncbi:MAG: putative zinc metalloprotease Rip3 [Firmicutes bacterium ADurb.Bin373]|nr:M50 family metallopeptidase [Bacillota bacterium]OQA11248.1 MAG: putative zinc metalloprotease Rip3 [Firmicutes bacterium ADurb.Bin373]